MGKTLIEKHLQQPKMVDGIAQVDGPDYYVYKVDDNGNKEIADIVSGDVRDALRLGERILDLDAIEMAFRDNPSSFDSVGPCIHWDAEVLTDVVLLTSPEDVKKVYDACVKALDESPHSGGDGDTVFEKAFKALTENAPGAYVCQA